MNELEIGIKAAQLAANVLAPLIAEALKAGKSDEEATREALERARKSMPAPLTPEIGELAADARRRIEDDDGA